MATIGRHRAPLLAGLFLVGALGLALLLPLCGRADSECDLYASPSGSDDAPGTASAPLRSPQRLADSLSAGQVGCFMAGTYDSTGRNVKVANPGITLTSVPGARATIVGRWWIAQGADGVTISHLNLNGRNDAGQSGPSLHAVDTRFDDVDVTNEHTVICFILGSSDYGVAVGTVIENSRIHDCGVLPPENGDHGIYVEDSRDAVIRNNWIYDNADRGIQLYPHAIRTHIYGNVIYGNGEGVIFSGTSRQVSSENVVEGNVIADSKVRWNAESYWDDLVGSGNVLRDNCVWASNPKSYYNQNGGVEPPDEGARGFTASGNVIAEPQFVDAAGGDFTQRSGSPCAFAEGETETATEEGTEAEPTKTKGPTKAKGPTKSKGSGKGHGAVTLEKHQRVVSANAPLRLTGHAEASAGSIVTVLRLRQGRWHRLARRRLRANGSFGLRRRLRGKHGAVRLRATVRGVGSSRVVRVGLMPGGPSAGLAPARRVGS
jgi:hypothetical protein